MGKESRSAKALGALLAVLLLAAGGGAFWLLLAGDRERQGTIEGRGGNTPVPTPSSEPLTPVPGAGDAGDEDEPAEGEVERRVVETPARPDGPSVAEIHLNWRALDAFGEPVAGVVFGSQSTGKLKLARSKADGTFAITFPRGYSPITVLDEEHTIVSMDKVRRHDLRPEYRVTLAKSIAFSGYVTDHTHRPVPGALVTVSTDVQVFENAAGEIPLLGTLAAIKTDRKGFFQFRRVPLLPHTRLSCRKTGYEDSVLAAPEESAEDMRIRMRQRGTPETSAWSLHGSVQNVQGEKIAGAHVELGSTKTTTDAEGAFELQFFEEPKVESTLLASSPGYAARVIPRFGQRIHDTWDAGAWIVLVLPGKAASIEGRLVNPDGDPLGGWQVQLLDGTPLPGTGAPSLAEDVAAGRPNLQRTGSDGKFIMLGLEPERDYRLRAFHAETMQSFESSPVPAGSHNFEFVVEPQAIWPRVEGRVRAMDGTPVGDVRVRLTLAVQETALHSSQETTTDADGHFELRDVPRHGVFLRLSGPTIMDQRFELDPTGSGNQLEVEVYRRAELEFVDEGEPSADTIRVLDDTGQPMQLLFTEKPGHPQVFHGRLAEGRSPVLTVGENAGTLVMYLSGLETERMDLSLVPGQRTLVQR